MTDPQPKSKDNFFAQLADISGAMTEAYGKDFAMGALVLAARFLAEGDAREKAGAAAVKGDEHVPPSDAMPHAAVPEHDGRGSAIWTPGSVPTGKNGRH